MLPISGFPLNAGVGHVLERLPTMPRMVTQVQKKVEKVNRGKTFPLHISAIYILFYMQFFLGNSGGKIKQNI